MYEGKGKIINLNYLSILYRLVLRSNTYPFRISVGAMQRGPTNLKKKPIIPEKPRRNWRKDDTIRAPCN